MQTSTANSSRPKTGFTSIAFIVGILLFLLPFVQIKCNNEPFAENTGIGLAFGTDYKVTGGIKSVSDTFSDKNSTETKDNKSKGKMYVVALIALILGVIGLIISLVSAPANKLNFLIGIVAAILLIVLLIQLKLDIKDDSRISSDDAGNNVKVTVDFTAWYYLSVLSFLAAAFFSYRQEKTMVIRESVPPNAPQIPIHNPGEQSEFPTSASESEIG